MNLKYYYNNGTEICNGYHTFLAFVSFRRSLRSVYSRIRLNPRLKKARLKEAHSPRLEFSGVIISFWTLADGRQSEPFRYFRVGIKGQEAERGSSRSRSDELPVFINKQTYRGTRKIPERPLRDRLSPPLTRHRECFSSVPNLSKVTRVPTGREPPIAAGRKTASRGDRRMGAYVRACVESLQHFRSFFLFILLLS